MLNLNLNHLRHGGAGTRWSERGCDEYRRAGRRGRQSCARDHRALAEVCRSSKDKPSSAETHCVFASRRSGEKSAEEEEEEERAEEGLSCSRHCCGARDDEVKGRRSEEVQGSGAAMMAGLYGWCVWIDFSTPTSAPTRVIIFVLIIVIIIIDMIITIVTITFIIIIVVIRGSSCYATCVPLPSDKFFHNIWGRR